MPLQFTTVEEPSFDRGIDARSAENQIKAGFAKDLVNVDIVEGRIRKRKGYSSHAGNIPVRVSSFRHDPSAQKLYFTLDSSIDLTRVSPGPLLAYGKSSTISTGGPFTTIGNNYKYYPLWTSNLRKAINTGSGSISAPFTEHTIDSTDIFVGLALSSSGVTLSGETTFTDSVTIDVTTKDITADYINNSGNPLQAFLYYKDQTAVAGQSYTYPSNLSQTFTASPNSTLTLPIPASTHNLDNYNIVYQLYAQDSFGNWEQVKPHSFSVNSQNGDVSIQVINGSPDPVSYKVILSATPLSQSRTIDSNSGAPTPGGISEHSTTFSNIESPFLFYTVYRQDPTNLNLLEEIHVNESLYNDTTKQWTLGWTPPPGETTSLVIYYQYGSVRANEIIVSDSTVSGAGNDQAPQLSLYGLDHKTIYGDAKKVNHRGWVTHLDSYRSPSATHVVAGLGGNLFAALTESDKPETLPTWYASLNTRIDSAQVIGPAFYEESSVPTVNPRTRGYYTFTGGLFHWAKVSAVEYQTSGTYSGTTKYTLLTPGGKKIPNISSPLVAGDQVTIEKMSHSRHNGIFEIVHVSDDGIAGPDGKLILYVNNPKLSTDDYNDTETLGRGGVFTDRIALQEASPFLANDKLLSSSWGEETNITVYKNSQTEISKTYTGNVIPVISTDGFPAAGNIFIGSTPYTYTSKTATSFTISGAPAAVTLGSKVYSKQVWVNQCFNYYFLNSGLFLSGQRTSNVVSLRTSNNTSIASLNIVAGDVLYYSELGREVTVTSVDAINGNITLDESITWYDNQSLPPSFSVLRRWYPIETPTSDASDDLLKPTVVRHFSALPYDSQPFLRSAMVQNNMYLTNGFDEVYKYDGANLYRAGMIPWQPGLFSATENVSGGGISLAATDLTGATVEGSGIKVAKAQAAKVSAGDFLRITFSNGVFLDVTVANKNDESTDTVIRFEETFSPPTTAGVTITSVNLIYEAYYFFRLNIRDRNQVVTASAVSGFESFLVRLVPQSSGSQKVLLRLVGLPAWDQYDYRAGNIELEIYRSKWTTRSVGGIPEMYRLRTEPLTFEKTSGYIDFEDIYGNDFLSDIDTVSGVLSPTAIPVNWDEPARSKYLTTLDNRLILANLTDWPTLSVNYITNKDTSYSSFAGQKYKFVRDSSKTTGTTNMVDRVTYELVNGADSSKYRTIYPVTGTVGHFKFQSTTALPTGLAAGDWVYLYHSTIASGNTAKAVIPPVPTTSLDVEGTSVFPQVGDLVHFTTTGSMPTLSPSGTLSSTQGYFVQTVSPNVSGITAVNQNTAASTIQLVSAAGFPTTGKVIVNGAIYSYSGVSGGTTLTGVSPLITFSKDAVVYLVPTITISETRSGSPITFATQGSGVSILWDGSELDNAGWYQIADVTAGVVTINSVDTTWTTIPKQFPDRALFATNTKDVPVLLGTDGNMSMTSGNGPIPYLNVIRRLGMAINATMRVTDVTIQTGTAPNFVYPYANFVPWLMAQSELSTGGTLYIKQPRAEATIPSLTLNNASITSSTYINAERTSANTAVPAKVTRYPSRVLLSYSKYPEIFSNPFGQLIEVSDSLVDINAADGQEITGIIPFFGSSAFGASQQDGVLVVFKQNSIYLVNVRTREVQKLETQGLGCTAPYSITNTKNGVAFANESGIYVLRGNYNIEYIGRFMERNWQERVDLDALSVMQGHHYGIGKQYKLSVPMTENSLSTYAENEEVYVYAYTAEADGNLGGWTRYTNHAATGWCNLFQDAFFADVNGNVQRIRNSGESVDYRDGSAAIESVIETRPTAFENTAIRKAVSNVVVHYRTNVNSESTSLGMAIDMATEYQLSTAYKVITSSPVKDGMSSTVGQSVTTIMHSFPKRKCLYAGVQIINNGKDENVEVAGMSYVVAGLGGAGVKQAAETEG